MSSAFLEVALSNGYIFNNASNNDIVLYPSTESSDLLLGVKSNADAGLVIGSSNINLNVQPANANGGTTVPAARFSVSNNSTGHTGGTGDMTNVTSNIMSIYDATSFPRVVHRSGDASTAAIYNFESNKNVFWGESTDCNFNYYSFRGRRVCIGYTNVAPSNHALDVNGNISLGSAGADCSVSTAGQFTLWGNRTGNTGFFHMIYAVGSNGANTQGDHIFFTRGNVTERMRIYSAGNVTVGGATATQALDVNGSVRINSGNNANNKLLVLWDGGTGDAVASACNFYGFGINTNTLRYQTPNNTNNHVFFQGANAVMLVGSNVGIGTTTPAYPLQISSGSIAMHNTNFAVGSCNSVIFQHFNGTTSNIGRVYSVLPGNNMVDLRFDTASNGNTTTAMCITGSSVGIGTTTPSSPLTINGGIDAMLLTGGGNPLSMTWSNSGGRCDIGLGAGPDQYTLGALAGDLVIRNQRTSGKVHMLGGGNTSPAFTINNNNNVGIGTTTPARTFQVQGQVRIGGSTPVLDFGDDFNVQIWRSGVSDMRLTTSGTDRITVLSGGNVGIGTMTPATALDVAGTVTCTDVQLSNLSNGSLSRIRAQTMACMPSSADAVRCVSTWTERTSVVYNAWRSVCWSPERSLFVAVSTSGTGNRVVTSPDGITWTTRTSATDNQWFSVCWSPERGLFVAVAQNGTGNRVMTSPDGITWTSRTSAADNNWN
jgi:hypothetical protein